MTLSMQAGLNFELALERLVEKGGRGDPVIREFSHVQHERDLGRPRLEALRAMAGRVQSDDLDSVVLAIEQGESLGVPMRESLGMQADVIRLRRSQRAEQAAKEAGVKITFPVMLVLISVLLMLFGGTIVKASLGKLW
jgi:tight adherence protein C